MSEENIQNQPYVDLLYHEFDNIDKRCRIVGHVAELSTSSMTLSIVTGDELEIFFPSGFSEKELPSTGSLVRVLVDPVKDERGITKLIARFVQSVEETDLHTYYRVVNLESHMR
ncbi:MAG: hypothetical protein ACTSYA_12435 [Candidatus Kariarchaeaceae archaeon]